MNEKVSHRSGCKSTNALFDPTTRHPETLGAPHVGSSFKISSCRSVSVTWR